MLKAIKIRIYPDSVQKEFISKQLGCCRFIYNKILDYKKTQYEQYNKNTSLSQMGKYLTTLKKQDNFLFLNNVHSKILQQSLNDLNSAYENFFKLHKGYPKFKS